MTKENKGKKLEVDFKNAMDSLARNPLLSYFRIPDARTTTTIIDGKARGKMSKRPGDYFVFYNGGAHLIELKELLHSSRIPTSRLTQIAKMMRFSMTGNPAGIIVFHTVIKMYRYLPIGWVESRKHQPSMDLIGLPQYSDLGDLCNDIICRDK